MLKLCRRCGAMVKYPETYCERCKGTAASEQREQVRRYDRKRNPQHRQFYNSKVWKTLSARKMQDAGYRCENCGELATEVHHVETLEENWGRRMDYTNLKALCHRCHDEVHGRFCAGGGGGRKSTKGMAPDRGGLLFTEKTPQMKFEKG